jgi:neutral ceramidase
MAFVMRWLLAAMIFLGGAASASAQPKSKVFRAGAYAQDITPEKFPISVNGGMADRQATMAHDRLHARCLVLDDGMTKIAFAVCDSCHDPAGSHRSWPS